MAITKLVQKKTRVFLVDDHPIVRQGLTQLINQQHDLTVCGEANSAAKALDLLRHLKPDFMTVDISLGGMDGLELIKTVKSTYPRLQILVVSMHDESLYAERALRAGAMGYIMKQEGTEKMIVAIRRLIEGRVYLSEEMDSKILQQMVGGQTDKPTSALERLSDRELEVFEMLGHGQGSRQIAEALYLSVKTVDSYRANIKEKMNLKSGIELLQHALKWVETEKSAN